MTVILGYSGLDGAADLISDRSDLSLSERRIFQGMDAAAALVIDGELVAAVQEERFSGRKFDHRFPAQSMRWCLEHAGLEAHDVDHVAHGFGYGPYERLLSVTRESRLRFDSVQSPARQNDLLAQHFPAMAARTQVRGVRHHMAHAISAAVASTFPRCLTVVADGMGETDAISVFLWDRGNLARLSTQDARSSLGLFYSIATMHLGYEPNSDEYRVMALAAYGDRSRFASVFEAAVELRPAGKIGVPLLKSDPGDPYREQYRAGRRWLAGMTFPEVEPSSASLGLHADFAAAAQRRLEEALEHVVSYWSAETGLADVALAGGVALNSVANGKLTDGGARRIYVQPAAGDEGTAVGAALWLGFSEARRSYPAVPLLGPSVGPIPQRHRWKNLGSAERTTGVAAALLAQGAVIGWATGRMEFGPRALGNRSILADPRSATIRDRVNSAVKFREAFRPLAPAVLSEAASTWFEVPEGTDLGHMTVVVNVRPEKRDLIPAVTHVDGTARVQVVAREHHPGFWSVIDAFAKRTGVPVVLNTSLNVKGQPIALTAADAMWTFDNSDLDVLIVENQALARGVWTALLDENEL